ncbi:uncharacterized protein BDZ99DRAFT_209093 [Mytilinidion resinicola]|uniref:Uncharacterized protein n=1 Tax=Mytilinidion resinicola TaxID=574789 RepID=A0A6A6Y2S3_9PEZI|nr:uncharacterized protein BDZ99DRAFT_209093 [Mytilinidion resinicola]KAF2802087.1 hypothetical protein BDZ99DRAFT_209093 [Mytilinidion resinicola]
MARARTRRSEMTGRLHLLHLISPRHRAPRRRAAPFATFVRCGSEGLGVPAYGCHDKDVASAEREEEEFGRGVRGFGRHNRFLARSEGCIYCRPPWRNPAWVMRVAIYMQEPRKEVLGIILRRRQLLLHGLPAAQFGLHVLPLTSPKLCPSKSVHSGRLSSFSIRSTSALCFVDKAPFPRISSPNLTCHENNQRSHLHPHAYRYNGRLWCICSLNSWNLLSSA